MKPEYNKTIVSAVSSAAAAAVTAKAITDIKKGKFCPRCEIKKLFSKIKLNSGTENDTVPVICAAPPMGWSSWNLFGPNINQKLIEEIIDACADSGLSDCGYKYVNIDDCWQSSARTTDGELTWDRKTFPDGIPHLVKYANDRGIKLGIYSSNGTHTCEDYPASLRHEKRDAQTFAKWGIEYFKYDFCHNRKIPSCAPDIALIEITDENNNTISVSPNDVTCSSGARVVADDNKKNPTGSYITGLDGNTGKISFSYKSEYDGKALITITVRKDMNRERFLIVKDIAGIHHVYAPSSMWSNGCRKIHTEIDVLKGENTIEMYNPIASRFDSEYYQYSLMGRELDAAASEIAEKTGTEKKPIVFSICEWGFGMPWKWGASAGHLWRTTMDIKPFWMSIMSIYEVNVRLYKYAHPGAWNDPDMLEVGNGALSYEENKTHFSLWCMMASPLILGNDIRKFVGDRDNDIYRILTDRDLIAIDQDPLGKQCKRIRFSTVDYLVRPLYDGKVAFCAFNKTKSQKSCTLNMSDILDCDYVSMDKSDRYNIFDAWEKRSFSADQRIDFDLPAHGCKVFVIG